MNAASAMAPSSFKKWGGPVAFAAPMQSDYPTSRCGNGKRILSFINPRSVLNPRGASPPKALGLLKLNAVSMCPLIKWMNCAEPQMNREQYRRYRRNFDWAAGLPQRPQRNTEEAGWPRIT